MINCEQGGLCVRELCAKGFLCELRGIRALALAAIAALISTSDKQKGVNERRQRETPRGEDYRTTAGILHLHNDKQARIFIPHLSASALITNKL